LVIGAGSGGAEELNIELNVPTPRLDMLYEVTLEDGRHCLLHIEFQGRRSKPTMPRRQLNHLSRLTIQNDWPLTIESFVLYTERNAGTQDTGNYQINRLDGSPAINWHYTPIHLWRQPAESLLNLGKPGIIPLTGLMSIQKPETTLPQIAAEVKSEPDEEKRGILFSSLLALLSDEEQLKMMEQLLEADEYILDTPFIRRYRQQIEAVRQEAQQAQQEAQQAQQEAQQAQQEAQQAQQEAQQAQQEAEEKAKQAHAQARREDILEAIASRFNPTVDIYRQVEKQLVKVVDITDLSKLFTAVLQTDNLTDIQSLLAEMLAANRA
jgi:F0F1-type ATP synthase membrane subunit b/b'